MSRPLAITFWLLLPIRPLTTCGTGPAVQLGYRRSRSSYRLCLSPVTRVRTWFSPTAPKTNPRPLPRWQPPQWSLLVWVRCPPALVPPLQMGERDQYMAIKHFQLLVAYPPRWLSSPQAIRPSLRLPCVSPLRCSLQTDLFVILRESFLE